MASTAQKRTTTKKKTTARSTASRSASGSGSSGGRSRTPQEPQRRPIRREVWGVVCLVLALCTFVSYFHAQAIFIDWLAKLLKGLVGYGYWLSGPAFLLTALILLFHRGRPVRLRVNCALLLPVLFGSLVHMVLASGEYRSSVAILRDLWLDGIALKSGGAISGALAVGSVAVFSKVASIIIFTVLFVVLLMTALRLTVGALIEKSRNRPRYEEEETGPLPVIPERREPAIRMTPIDPPVKERAAAPKPVIDIPLDGEVRRVEKKPGILKGFFRQKSAEQPTPDQLLMDQQRERQPVVVTVGGRDAAVMPPPVTGPVSMPEPEAELSAVEAVQPVEKKKKSLLASVMEPLTRPAESAQPQPVPQPAVQPENSVEAEPAAVPTAPAKRADTAGEVDKAAAEVTAEIENQPAAEDAYQYPPITLLNENHNGNFAEVGAELRNNSRRLGETLSSFGVDATPGEVIHGPSVTRYEFTLDQGVKLSKITNLADDIALALGASGVRIAPIPDKISVVGIEVPNKQVTSVLIRDVLGSPEFAAHKSNVAFAVGKDIGGNSIIGNIAKLPHVLIAGTTGSGKSVCTNSLIISLLYKSSPRDVRFIMVDPKMVELAPYNGIPHLLIPVVTDPKKAAGALQWAVFEMMKRYKLFSEHNVKDLAGYNALAKTSDELEHMASVVVVIDELADLMLVAAKEVEESICRVAQMGRAAGVHLVIATQRPSADVITGLMKANIPSRIAFAVASSLESRIILDTAGAEKLVGKGDMLYAPLGNLKPTRVQGCFISPEEIERVVQYVKTNAGEVEYSDEVMKKIEESVQEKERGGKGGGSAAADTASEDGDELLPSAVEVVLETGQASVSMLQRRLKLGYSRAARLVDQMEERGIVGPFEGSKPRQLLITKAQWQEMQMGGSSAASPAETAGTETDETLS